MKLSTYETLQFLFFLFLFLSSFSVFSYTYSIILTLFVIFFGLSVVIARSRHANPLNKAKILIIVFSVVICNELLVDIFYDINVFSLDFFKFFLRFIIVLFVCQLAWKFLSLRVLENVLFFLMFHSITGFLLQFLLPSSAIHTVNYTSMGASGSFFHIFHYSQFVKNFNIYRNQGIFAEPGLLQYAINLLLYILLFVRGKVILAALLFFPMITTFSTTGLVIFFLVWTYFFLVYVRGALKSIFFVFMAVILSLVFLQYIEYIVYNKLGSDSVSYNMRLYDFYKALDVISNSPFGIGFKPESYRDYFFVSEDVLFSDVYQFLEYDRGLTNGFLDLFVKIGIPLGFVFIILIYSQTLFFKDRLVIFMINFITYLSEPVIFSNVSILFFSSSVYFITKKFRVKTLSFRVSRGR